MQKVSANSAKCCPRCIHEAFTACHQSMKSLPVCGVLSNVWALSNTRTVWVTKFNNKSGFCREYTGFQEGCIWTAEVWDLLCRNVCLSSLAILLHGFRAFAKPSQSFSGPVCFVSAVCQEDLSKNSHCLASVFLQDSRICPGKSVVQISLNLFVTYADSCSTSQAGISHAFCLASQYLERMDTPGKGVYNLEPRETS